MATNFIHISDGAIDDTISSIILIKFLKKHNKQLALIAVTDADCIVDASCKNYSKICNWLVENQIVSKVPKIVKSESRVLNPFPWEWRNESMEIGKINELANVQNLPNFYTNEELFRSLCEAKKSSVIILATGPLTTLADVLKKSPILADKIKEIHWMGGAISVNGNLISPGSKIPKEIQDKSQKAEWNVFCDPEAVIYLWNGFVNIEWFLYPLDLTNKTKVTSEFYDMLLKNRNSKIAKCMHEMYNIQLANKYENIWDVDATMGMIERLHLHFGMNNINLRQTIAEPKIINLKCKPNGEIVKCNDLDGKLVNVCKKWANLNEFYINIMKIIS